MDSRKSSSHDNMYARLIKDGIDSLDLPLYILFRKLLGRAKISLYCELCSIVPIYWTESNANTNNYRLVSLTSVVCKILEKIIKNYYSYRIKSISTMLAT